MAVARWVAQRSSRGIIIQLQFTAKTTTPNIKLRYIILIIIAGVLLTARMLTRDNFHTVTVGEIYRSAQLSPGKLEKVVTEYGIQTVLSLRKMRADNARYGVHQPWLIGDFGKQEYLDSGWTASQPLRDFADGCHELILKFSLLDGSSWTSPPSARICIN